MKNRKKTAQQLAEDRNALYRKVTIHNIDLANKNTELSSKISFLQNICKNYEDYFNRKRWWQFWK